MKLVKRATAWSWRKFTCLDLCPRESRSATYAFVINICSSIEHHRFARIAVSFSKTWILSGQQNPDAENSWAGGSLSHLPSISLGFLKTQIQDTALHEKKWDTCWFAWFAVTFAVILGHDVLNLVIIDLSVPCILKKNVQNARHVPNQSGSSNRARRKCCGQENEPETYGGMCTMFWVHVNSLWNAGSQAQPE